MGSELVGSDRLCHSIGFVEEHHRRTPLAEFAGEGTGEGAEPTELADHDAAVGHPPEAGAHAFLLTYRRDPGSVAGLAAHPQDRAHCLGPADGVGSEPAVGLEIGQGLGGALAEDSVHPSTVETEPSQS